MKQAGNGGIVFPGLLDCKCLSELYRKIKFYLELGENIAKHKLSLDDN